ncbi:MAG: SsrA-binding protein SmpB [Deltaproteobacteria bacterium]|nr:SsrA-binding protein SmpB [Deltaproteobacteria bacterium]MBW2253541.1 SsrA-binding protein SmpB [Deltaproteobacteria bacterium]
MPEPERNIVTNRRARYDYHLHDRFEAGIALLGSEVKSLRAGKANLQEAYVRLQPGGAWLVGCHISPYTHANRLNHEPLRERRLLLNRREIHKLKRGTREKGMTIVPLRLYFKGSLVKVELALAKGKRLHDKRQTLKARDAKREMDRGR